MGVAGCSASRYTQPMNTKPKQNPQKSQQVNLIKLSADVHKRDFKVCRQIGDQNIQPAQTFSPEQAYQWAIKQLESAKRVVFCYEAGFSGFHLARRLEAAGVEVIVMCPQKLDERHKKVNTDKRDARAIAGRLDRYLAGNQEALTPVRIPTETEEDERAQTRQRDQLLKLRKQVEAQGRSLLVYKGLECPPKWWQSTETAWQLWIKVYRWPAPIVALLEPFRRLAQATHQEILVLTAKIKEAAQLHLPKNMPELPIGFGALSVEIVRREVCQWSRFENRRKPGSFFGLCPSESTSGPRQFQGSITKTGNPRCRHALIEMAWRMFVFQPNYWVVQKFNPKMPCGLGRAVERKKIIVAMARLIGIDLWRLYTGQTTLAKLGLKKKGEGPAVSLAAIKVQRAKIPLFKRKSLGEE